MNRTDKVTVCAGVDGMGLLLFLSLRDSQSLLVTEPRDPNSEQKFVLRWIGKDLSDELETGLAPRVTVPLSEFAEMDEDGEALIDAILKEVNE